MQHGDPHPVSTLADEPWVARRPEQPYVALRTRVRADAPASVECLWDELLAWLGERGVPPVGVPFVRHLQDGAGDELELEVGVPVAPGTAADGPVHAGALPAGLYVALVHEGPLDRLADADAALRAWADQRGLQPSEPAAQARGSWGGRLARRFADPAVDGRCETELAYFVAA